MVLTGHSYTSSLADAAVHGRVSSRVTIRMTENYYKGFRFKGFLKRRCRGFQALDFGFRCLVWVWTLSSRRSSVPTSLRECP